MFTNPREGDYVRFKRSYVTTNHAGTRVVVPSNKLHRVLGTRSPRGREALQVVVVAGEGFAPVCISMADLAGWGVPVSGHPFCACPGCLALIEGVFV